jgi:hypothetical protein
MIRSVRWQQWDVCWGRYCGVTSAEESFCRQHVSAFHAVVSFCEYECIKLPELLTLQMVR